MLEYFNRSQEVRREIEADKSLLEKISLVFTSSEGEVIQSDIPGMHNKVYRIGQTESGLFVALRVPKRTYAELKRWNEEVYLEEMRAVRERYEQFCQVAAVSSNRYNHGEESIIGYPKGIMRPVSFCVGVVCEEKSGVITEDVTEGGRYRLEPSPCEPSATRKEGSKKVDRVLIDLDIDPSLVKALVRMQRGKMKSPKVNMPEYFAEKNRLSLLISPRTLE